MCSPGMFLDIGWIGSFGEMVGFGGISSIEDAGRVSRDDDISGISVTGGIVPIIYSVYLLWWYL